MQTINPFHSFIITLYLISPKVPMIWTKLKQKNNSNSNVIENEAGTLTRIRQIELPTDSFDVNQNNVLHIYIDLNPQQKDRLKNLNWNKK